MCSQKSIRGGRVQRKTAVRQLANRSNRLKRNAGGNIKKRLTMAADQIQMQGGRRRRSASVSSVHSRLGVSRGPRRNSNFKLNNINNTGPRRRLQRSNSISNLKRSASNGNLARSQSRSNLQRTNSNTNLNAGNRQRNRSRSRNRLNVSNGKPNRRRLNRNFQGTNLRRSNSKGNLATAARFGINRNNNPINARRNRRRANAGQSIGTNNQINRQVDVTHK